MILKFSKSECSGDAEPAVTITFREILDLVRYLQELEETLDKIEVGDMDAPDVSFEPIHSTLGQWVQGVEPGFIQKVAEILPGDPQTNAHNLKAWASVYARPKRNH